ncbi:MAG: Cys-tRNA(Pro) deacylase [Anaerolineae bacterium]|nr:Cys-tRNA(Pro) deacylase [Anaerolineae bacterium]
MKTNNVTRLLQARKIPFTAFELPAKKIGAVETAQLLNVEPSLVYKTIVLKREKPGKHILAVVPGDREVNLKLVAEALNEKKVLLTTQKEAEAITRLQAGGISPLALLGRGFQVILDSNALKHDMIHISGGERGLNICLPVKNLIELTQAKTAPISSKTDENSVD